MWRGDLIEADMLRMLMHNIQPGKRIQEQVRRLQLSAHDEQDRNEFAGMIIEVVVQETSVHVTQDNNGLATQFLPPSPGHGRWKKTCRQSQVVLPGDRFFD